MYAICIKKANKAKQISVSLADNNQSGISSLRLLKSNFVLKLKHYENNCYHYDGKPGCCKPVK